MIEYSVIIPAYNVEEFISQCIESVLTQSFSNYEIVLVNDGSKDNTLSICQQYAENDERVIIINKANGGVSAARKDAVCVARGRYLVFLDADDWLEQGCFEALHQIVERHNPDIIVYGENSGDINGKFRPVVSKYAEGLYSRTNLEYNIFPHIIQDERATCFSTSIIQKAIKRELFKAHLLSNSRAPIGEDGACLIPCIYHADSLFITHTPYYYYRYNENSATKSKKVFNWDNPEIINRHIEAHIDVRTADFQQQIYRKIVHDVFNVVITRFYQDISYWKIIEDIEHHLKNPYYREAIKKARFANSRKAQLMSFSLRYKFYFLIYLLSKLK